MPLLLDTHVILWFLQDSPELPIPVKELIIDPDHDVFVSIASYWEIGIKQKKSPENMPWSVNVPALESLAINQRIETLPLTSSAIEEIKRLSLAYRDPFDRIIAASAIVSGMRLVSCDELMDDFVTDRIWG